MPLTGGEKLIAKYGENASKVMRALSLDANGKLIKRTPRDTGRAAANWNASVGAPDASVNLEATSADIEATIARGQTTLAEYDIHSGRNIYLSNGLPYIPSLEDGHSKQAPAGMIALTAAELQQTAEGIINVIRNEG